MFLEISTEYLQNLHVCMIYYEMICICDTCRYVLMYSLWLWIVHTDKLYIHRYIAVVWREGVPSHSIDSVRLAKGKTLLKQGAKGWWPIRDSKASSTSCPMYSSPWFHVEVNWIVWLKSPNQMLWISVLFQSTLLLMTFQDNGVTLDAKTISQDTGLHLDFQRRIAAKTKNHSFTCPESAAKGSWKTSIIDDHPSHDFK